MQPVVIDTNIFVSAMMNASGAPREVLRLALTGEIIPLMGNAVFSEYEDVLSRADVIAKCVLNENERQALLNALMSVSKWVSVYYLWRPNLRDESDNHVIELAIAGGAEYIISGNKRDFERADLIFPSLKIVTALKPGW